MTAWFIPIALEAALRSLALAAVVGLALTLLRVRNVPARKAAWSVVLLASFAMPLLMRAVPSRVGWVLPIRFAPAATPHSLPTAAPQAQPIILSRIAIPKPSPSISAAGDRVSSASAALSLDLTPAVSVSAVPAARSASQRTFHLPPIGPLALALYLAVAAILVFRLGLGLNAAIRLWMTADRVSPLIAPEPSVRASNRIASPVTIGSGIVLPADYRDWDSRKLRMVMAHERSHVRQLDFYLQLLAGLYAAIFWFSPLGWLLRRTLCALGEAIGDRAGIDAATSRTGYASLVLEFAALPHKLLPGVAMARSTNLSRRVDSMLNENLFRTLFSEGRRRAMASLLVIPAALFAVTALVRVPSASAQSAPQNTQPSSAQTPTAAPATGQSTPPTAPITTDEAPADQAAPAAPATPTVPPSAAPMPAAPAAAVDTPAPAAPDFPPTPASGVDTPAPAAPAVPPAPPTPDAAYTTSYGSGDSAGYGVSYGQSASSDVHVQNGKPAHHYAYHYSDDGDSWALVENNDANTMFSGDFDGEAKAEIDRARKLAKGSFLWFRHDGKEYIVTDPAILARIEEMQEPIRALGKQQEALGQQQEALGKLQQDMVRTQTDTITIRMPDLSKEIADLTASMTAAKVDAYKIDEKALADLQVKVQASVNQMMTPEKLALIQKQIADVQVQLTPERIADMQAKLGEMQARIGELQAQMGEKQGAIGERMGKLGEKEGRLGEQQGRLGEQQGRLAEEMNRSVQQMIDQTLKSGTAKPVQ